MTTPELAKAMERQQREARRRRDRQQQTVDRFRDARNTPPGVAPVGDPEVLHREAMLGEVARMRSRGLTSVVYALILAGFVAWQCSLVAGGHAIGLKAGSGLWLSTLGAVFVTGMIVVSSVTAVIGMRRLDGWSAESVDARTRGLVMGSAALASGVSLVSTAVLLWFAVG